MRYKSQTTQDRFSFPAKLTPDSIDGGYVVTFRDLPEAITQGDSIKEALTEASDCLDEAIAARLDDGLDIPEPSDVEQGEYLVSLPIETSMKTAINLAVRELNMTKVQLSQVLNVDEKEARRILNPHHHTKVKTMERTLITLNKKPMLVVV